MQVNVVDALMGRGKTSAAINYINSAPDEQKFLYITPFLLEVERIIESCPDKKFKQPDKEGGKKNNIKHLFEKGVNIVSTHSLFRMFDNEIIELAYENNYVLIMDEVADVIETLNITKHDLNVLLEKYTKIEDGHVLRWTAGDYDGRFDDYKRLCELGCVGIYNETAILWLFPISVFKAFREIYILTYLFEAQTQKYYFDFYGVKYNYLYISGDNMSNYNFCQDVVKYEYPDYKKLIHICDNKKLNSIGDLDTSLSRSWYQRNYCNKLIKILKNNTANFFKNYTKTKSQLNLWTTFKDFKDVLGGKGYTKGFLSSNMRAVNAYKDRVAVAYLINKFFNPHVKMFFESRGIAVNEDYFALSEMVQFIWRSAIRDEKEIWLYLPSSRMRKLLIDWLEKINNDS